MIAKFLKELEYAKEVLNNGEKITRIFYPCCGMDVGVDKIFSDSVVVHLDCNERIVQMLRDKGYLSFWGKFENFDLESNCLNKCDAIVLFDQVIEDKNEIYEAVKRNLKEKGYVICNNTYNAAYLMKNFGFDLLFVLADGKEKEAINLEDWNEKMIKENLKNGLYEKLLRISQKYNYDSVTKMKRDLLNGNSKNRVISEIKTVLQSYGITKDPLSFLMKLSNQKPNAFYVFRANDFWCAGRESNPGHRLGGPISYH